MIANPLASGAPEQAGDYDGAMYAPVTIPTAYPYAIPAPSTAQPQQVAPLPSLVPLNAYVATQAPQAMPAPNAAVAATDDCGCGGGARPLKWYEILTAVALVVIAVTAFAKK